VLIAAETSAPLAGTIRVAVDVDALHFFDGDENAMW
jgi:hypothetical protein